MNSTNKFSLSFLVVAIIFFSFIWLLAVTGCAQLGPYTLDPGVYRSSRDNAIAANEATTAEQKTRKEKAQTGQLNEKLKQGRMVAVQGIYLAVIKNSTASESIPFKDAVDVNGVIGGVPCLFNNTTNYDINALIIKMDEGIFQKHEWILDIRAGGHREYNLETGLYNILWRAQRYGSGYGKEYEGAFDVTPEVHLFHDATNRNYHGGYEFYR